MGFNLKVEPHIRLSSENRREHWARIGDQVMCWSMYSYILGIRHCTPNTFLALPNLRNRQILANILCESQFSRLLVNLCKNTREYWRILGNSPVLAYSLKIDVCVVPPLELCSIYHLFSQYRAFSIRRSCIQFPWILISLVPYQFHWFDDIFLILNFNRFKL